MLKRRKLMPLLILLLFCLSGCGSNEKVYLSNVPKNLTFVRCDNNSSFCIPENYKKFIDVTNTQDMKLLDGGYHYTENRTETYVALKDGLYNATILPTNLSSEELAKQLELQANIRINETSLIASDKDSHKNVTKSLYYVKAEGLFTPSYYADFYGYLSIIETDDATCVFIAASPTSYSDTDLSIAKSFTYEGYNVNINRNPREATNQTNLLDSGELGDYVKASVLYRGNITTQVDFGICLTESSIVGTIPINPESTTVNSNLENTESTTITNNSENTTVNNNPTDSQNTIVDKNSINLQNTMIKELPTLKNGYHYETATFLIDTQGYDVSEDVPDIRIRTSCSCDMKDINYGQTYILERNNREIKVLYIMKDHTQYSFKVGRDGREIKVNYDKEKIENSIN